MFSEQVYTLSRAGDFCPFKAFSDASEILKNICETKNEFQLFLRVNITQKTLRAQDLQSKCKKS